MSSAKRKEFSFFAGRLRELLAGRKVTQAALAAAAKTSPPTLRTWLAGTNSPDIHQLILLADFFGLATADELIRPVRDEKKCRVIPRKTLLELSRRARATAEDLDALLSGPVRAKPRSRLRRLKSESAST